MTRGVGTLFVIATVFITALGLAAADPATAQEHRLGAGLHFWKTIDNLPGDGFTGIEDEGYSLVFSYQWAPGGLFRYELDLEYSGDGFGGSTEPSISPIAFVLLGKGLYGGLGVGITISDGLDNNLSDPFWAARLGFEFHILPKIRVDVSANYRAGAFNDLDQFETDAITLGAVLRYSL